MFVKAFVTVLLVLQVCWASKAFNYLHPRITDGVDALPGEFPYQVSIIWGEPPMKPFRHNCGGSIVNHAYVLTAAHCIMTKGTMKVVVGRYSINNPNPEFEQTIDIEKAIVHENYVGGISKHDIALLKLKTRIVYNERVSPVMIPEQDEVYTGEAVLSGWGSVSKVLMPTYPDILQKADVTLLDNEICENAIHKITDGTGQEINIFPTQVCSGPLTDTISACSGDSGGPLVQYKEQFPMQVGIVSFGLYPCGHRGVPSVYTRVASYADWIFNNMDTA